MDAKIYFINDSDELLLEDTLTIFCTVSEMHSLMYEI